MKKISVIFFALFMIIFSVTACSNESALNADVLGTDPDEVIALSKLNENETSKAVGFQLELPEKGEEIAVVETTMGVFKIRFFPEEAPKAVYNFKKLAQQGYYNGIKFHRIIEDFMVQGGDPTATGIGGDSVWGEDFEDEFNKNLLNITGSVSMANKGPDTNSSQFFINYSSKTPDWEYYEMFFELYATDADVINELYGGCVDLNILSDEAKALYNEHGGSLHLDGAYNTAGKGHTVFAQVFEGLDIIEKISKVNTDEDNKPIGDVIIKKVTIEKYE